MACSSSSTEVTQIAPDAGGSAVTIVATSDTIVGAFRDAAIYAVLAIAAILASRCAGRATWLLVLAPLILSALLTLLVAVLLPLPLNFANIIALPLLLGVGVSFNIYFVMNWRDGRRLLLGSATARAIVFSALTTGTAFGSLALSAHPGTASMGDLLLISLACTLLASLVFVPALLASLTPLAHQSLILPAQNASPCGAFAGSGRAGLGGVGCDGAAGGLPHLAGARSFHPRDGRSCGTAGRTLRREGQGLDRGADASAAHRLRRTIGARRRHARRTGRSAARDARSVERTITAVCCTLR